MTYSPCDCGWTTVIFAVLLKFGYAVPSSTTSPGISQSCQEPYRLENGLWSETINPRVLHYKCHEGFKLIGPPKQECQPNGTWNPTEMPICVSKNVNSSQSFNDDTVCNKPFVLNGNVEVIYYSTVFKPGDTETITCQKNFAIKIDNKVLTTAIVRCSHTGDWVSENGWPTTLECNVRQCDSAPEIPNSKMMMVGDETGLEDGVKAYYSCDTGYSLVHPHSQELVCSHGEWVGDLPSCVPILNCTAPGKVDHGQFTVRSDTGWPFYDRVVKYNFPIGSRAEYFCDTGYKMKGLSVIECLQNKQWSHAPPVCVSYSELSLYCPSVNTINNGDCFCGSNNDLTYCKPFYSGLSVECGCQADYKLIGRPVVTCQNNGTWDYKMPICVQEVTIGSGSEGQGKGAGHMSTLAIVVATACSVLGVLLLVMVIMVLRRRKPRPHFSHHVSTSTPPPYSRVQNQGIDEHDRVLLIGYENSRIPLPTYEEAISGRSHGGNFVTRGGGINSQVGEYRPLPSLPNNFRSVSQSGDSSNRHSIITTSTMNRDGLSEVFGSLDTVNVSVSDTSTAVTVETFDSATSHYSNVSGRATAAGSLRSSSGSLATEDAPLLDNNQRDEPINLGEIEDDVQDKTEN